MIVPVERAARLLIDGRVVAYPTETVYGLGADVHSAKALRELLALKGRDPERGLSLLIPDLAALEGCAPGLPERARALAARFWPGPLTLVVPVADAALASVATSLGVGFRCSPHPTAAALARAARHPLVSTSCNRSGEPPCLCAREVREVFGAELPIVGGNPAEGRTPSTVVAVDRDGGLQLLREGALPYGEIEEIGA